MRTRLSTSTWAKEFTLERTGLLGSTVSRVAVQGLTDICGANMAVFSCISVARYQGSLRVKGDGTYATGPIYKPLDARVGGPRNAQEPLSRTDLSKKGHHHYRGQLQGSCRALTVVMVSRVQVESDGCKLA